MVVVALCSTPARGSAAQEAGGAGRTPRDDVIPLVAAAACVGIVIGVVTLTGIGTKLPTAILGLSQGNLLVPRWR